MIELLSSAEATIFKQLLADRFSCRKFLSTLVPDEVIDHILTCSQKTPSWCNTQPWQLLITSGKSTDQLRKALYEHVLQATPQSDLPFPERYEGVYQSRRRECGFQLYDSVGIEKSDRAATQKQGMENFLFFDAPHFALITSPRSLGVYGAIDCGGYINNFLLAAHSVGVATVPQAAIANYSDFIHSYFDIDENYQVVCGISFGYADMSHPINHFRTHRAPLKEVVQFISE